MTKESKSTFLIKSTAERNKSFGTGFCIHKDSNGSFLLTCAHVVESCGKNDLEIDSYRATCLHISKDDDIIDMALLYVEGLTNTIALKLSNEIAQEGDGFNIDGYRPHKKNHAKEPLKGYIKKSYTLESKKSKTVIYDLSINEGDSIEQGYSGSAVVSAQTGLVMAVATDRKRDAKNAYATPIAYLKEIWAEMPNDIFVDKSLTLKWIIQFIKEKIMQISSFLRKYFLGTVVGTVILGVFVNFLYDKLKNKELIKVKQSSEDRNITKNLYGNVSDMDGISIPNIKIKLESPQQEVFTENNGSFIFKNIVGKVNQVFIIKFESKDYYSDNKNNNKLKLGVNHEVQLQTKIQ